MKEKILDLQVQAMFHEFEKQVEINLTIPNELSLYFLNSRCKIYNFSYYHSVKIFSNSRNSINIAGSEDNVENAKIELGHLIEHFKNKFTKCIKIKPNLKEIFNKSFLNKISNCNCFVIISISPIRNVIQVRGRKEYVLQAICQIRIIIFCLNKISLKINNNSTKNLTKKVHAPMYSNMAENKREKVNNMVKENKIIERFSSSKTRKRAMRRKRTQPRNKLYDRHSLGKIENIVNYTMKRYAAPIITQRHGNFRMMFLIA